MKNVRLKQRFILRFGKSSIKVLAPPFQPIPGALYIYIYTRVDPCIKCTRSKLDTGQGVLGLVAPEDLLSVCCLVLPLVLSSVVLSPLVSSCLGFSALVSSCVVCWASPGPFLGLSRASLGTHFGGPFWGLGPSWASPGLLLGVLGGSWAVLSGLGWFLRGPGLVPGWARRRRTTEGSEPPYVFIV